MIKIVELPTNASKKAAAASPNCVSSPTLSKPHDACRQGTGEPNVQRTTQGAPPAPSRAWHTGATNQGGRFGRSTHTDIHTRARRRALVSLSRVVVVVVKVQWFSGQDVVACITDWRRAAEGVPHAPPHSSRAAPRTRKAAAAAAGRYTPASGNQARRPSSERAA